jgi:hypothetical protein
MKKIPYKISFEVNEIEHFTKILICGNTDKTNLIPEFIKDR